MLLWLGENINTIEIRVSECYMETLTAGQNTGEISDGIDCSARR